MPYAIELDGAQTPISVGLPLVTTKLRLAADEVDYYKALAIDDAERAAIVEGAVIDRVVKHPTGAPQGYGPEDLGRYLIVEIPLTLAEVQAQRRAAADAEYAVRRQGPMSWDFGATVALDDAGVDHGPAGVQQLQMRDSSTDNDLMNWLAAAQGASVLVAVGAGATLSPLKTAANLWVQASADQVLDVLIKGDGAQVSALERGRLMLQRFGALKAAITAATDTAAALAIDVTAGWPA